MFIMTFWASRQCTRFCSLVARLEGKCLRHMSRVGLLFPTHTCSILFSMYVFISSLSTRAATHRLMYAKKNRIFAWAPGMSTAKQLLHTHKFKTWHSFSRTSIQHKCYDFSTVLKLSTHAEHDSNEMHNYMNVCIRCCICTLAEHDNKRKSYTCRTHMYGQSNLTSTSKLTLQ